MNREKVRRLAVYGLLVALAFVFSYIEMLLPFNLGIPGVKLGLGNLVVVVAMCLLRRRDALVVAVTRILLVGLTFGSPSSMIYSLVGGLLSFAVMAALLPNKRVSLYGVSMAGGLAHNVGQLAVAVWATQTVRIVWYLPILLVSGVTTGVLVGLAAVLMIKRLPSRLTQAI